MTENEKQLAGRLLKMAGDKFPDRICNDVPNEFWDGWTPDERRQFVKEYHEWNGDPENYDPDDLSLPDFGLMWFLAHKISTG